MFLFVNGSLGFLFLESAGQVVVIPAAIHTVTFDSHTLLQGVFSANITRYENINTKIGQALVSNDLPPNTVVKFNVQVGKKTVTALELISPDILQAFTLEFSKRIISGNSLVANVAALAPNSKSTISSSSSVTKVISL
jgi:low affinity Fe/Cu permease